MNTFLLRHSNFKCLITKLQVYFIDIYIMNLFLRKEKKCTYKGISIYVTLH